MSSTDNKALIRRWLDGFNQGNLSIIDELFAPGFRYYDPSIPNGGTLETFKQFMGMLHQAYPNARANIQEQVAEGDVVTTRFTVRGTQQGAFMGIPASHKPVSFDVIAMTRCDNGRIVEDHFLLDTLGMLQQIGAVPAPV